MHGRGAPPPAPMIRTVPHSGPPGQLPWWAGVRSGGVLLGKIEGMTDSERRTPGHPETPQVVGVDADAPSCGIGAAGNAHEAEGADRKQRLAVLMARVAQGDRGAFAHVYDAIAPIVHGIAVRVIRDRAVAQEITQDVMLDVWRLASGFDPEKGSVFAWSATMAHRRSVDRVRSSQARRDREDRSARGDFARSYDDVEESVQQRFEVSRVRDCLGTLTDLERDSVVEAYYGGLSYRQVAEKLDAALATVKSRIRSGLRRLQGCLEVD